MLVPFDEQVISTIGKSVEKYAWSCPNQYSKVN